MIGGQGFEPVIAAMLNFGSVELELALFGAAGGLVRSLRYNEPWRKWIVNMAIGALCAVPLAPFFEGVLGDLLVRVVDDRIAINRLSAFVVGLLGQVAAGYVIDVVEARKADASRKRGPE